MKKTLYIIFKIILSLLLISPILGACGVFPPPTPDMYSGPRAYAFIETMMNSYIVMGIAITCFLTLVSLWMKREALAALLLLPLTVNIIGFHATIDGGLLTAGALMANILFLSNIYLLWRYRDTYRGVLKRGE